MTDNYYFKCALLMMLILLLLGCTSTTKKTEHPENSEAFTVDLSRWGDLPPKIGNTSSIQEPAYNLNVSEIIPELPKLTGYHEPTKVYFGHLRSSNYFKSLPGQSIQFERLGIGHPHRDLRFRYQLAEVNAQFDVLAILDEVTTSKRNISIELPAKENALYLLTLEALEEDDQIADTLIYLVEIVPRVINAELTLEQTSFRKNEAIQTTLSIMNYGPNGLRTGTDYTVERYQDGEWHTLSFRDGLNFTGQLLSVQVGQQSTQRASVPVLLPEGTYRFVKWIKADLAEGFGTLEHLIAAEFVVEGINSNS